MERTATAIAVSIAVLSAGLAAVSPGTATSTSVCDQDDFSIPDSEPLDLNARSLNAGASEVGTEDVSSGSPEDLRVEMVDSGSNGKLHWVVKYDDGQSCVKLDSSDCEGTIESDNTMQECDLDAPSSGTRVYHVFVEEVNSNNLIEYKAWEE